VTIQLRCGLWIMWYEFEITCDDRVTNLVVERDYKALINVITRELMEDDALSTLT